MRMFDLFQRLKSRQSVAERQASPAGDATCVQGAGRLSKGHPAAISIAWQSLLLACLCFALPSHAAPASQTDPPSHLAPTVSQVAHQIICDCPDCGKQTVDQCMATCTRGKELAKEIGGQLAQGKSQDQVLEFMGKTHGEQILAIPRQSNFLGRMAPLAPFLILLLGIVPIAYITRTRHRKVKVTGPKPAPKAPKSDEKLEDALKSFDY